MNKRRVGGELFFKKYTSEGRLGKGVLLCRSLPFNSLISEQISSIVVGDEMLFAYTYRDDLAHVYVVTYV